MGVKGLMSFFSSQDYVCDQYELYNVPVVIDGSNLYHMLYHGGHQGNGSLAWSFGGQYARFAKRVRKFFANLRKCGIKPYVLCDGCYEANKQKLHTIRDRRNQRLDTLRIVNRSCLGGLDKRCKTCSLPPLLMETMFLDVLRELHIPFLIAPGEADSLIASLANTLNATVLSWDSDFYIFPLVAGFVPLHKLAWNQPRERSDGANTNVEPQYFLSCHLYHQRNVYLTGNRRVEPHFFPLFASLMGNDFVKKSDLDPFFQSVFQRVYTSRQHSQQQKKRVDAVQNRAQKQRQMIDLLEWLQQYGTADAALERIVNFFPQQQRATCLEKLHLSLAQYHVDKDCSAVCTFMESRQMEVVAESPFNATTDHFLSQLPDSLKLSFYTGHLPPWFCNALNTRHTFEPLFVECLAQGGAFVTCWPLRRLAYELVIRNSTSPVIKVTEEGRRGSHAKKRIREVPLQQNLLKDEEISLERFIACILSDEVSLPEKANLRDSQQPFLTVWLLLKLWSHHMLSLSSDGEMSLNEELICLSMLVMALSLLKGSTSPPPPFVKVTGEPTVSYSRKFNIDLVNYFNQLQMLYLHLRLLVTLFGRTESLPTVPTPERLFDGYIFYNLCQEMFRRPAPLLYAYELCGGRHSETGQLLVDILEVLLPRAQFKPVGNSVPKPVKVPKPTEEAIDSSEETVDESVLGECEPEDESDDDEEFADSENPFALLSTRECRVSS